MIGRAGYWRAVALVFSGTATAQMIPILGSLVIARIYTPSDFGIFMAWFGLVSLGAVFATGRFEMALALEPDGAERAQSASVVLVTMALLLCTAAVPGIGLYIAFRHLLPATPLELVLLFVPAVAAAASVLIFQAWAAAEGRFKTLSMMRISQAALVTSLQIGIGFLWPSTVSLALAHVTGVLGGLCVMVYFLRPSKLENGRRSIFEFWKKYRRFPTFSLPADTVNTAAAQLPLTILAHRFGAETAGYVAMAFRMLGAPISLLGSAVLDVFKRRASESWRAIGSCRSAYVETFLVLAAGSAAATTVFWFAGEDLFALAFGERWREAGKAAIILLPLFALRFVASPLSYTFYIAQKQSVDLVWQLCLFVMTLTSLLVFSTYQDSLTAYALGYSFLYMVYIALSYRFSNSRTA